MEQTVIDYYMDLPKHLHFVRVAEQSDECCDTYRMLSDYGSGSVRILNFHQQFLIVLADFTTQENFEKVSDIKKEYFEISQFETDSSSFKVGDAKSNKWIEESAAMQTLTRLLMRFAKLASQPDLPR